MSTLDVIIPVKNRQFISCVESLLAIGDRIHQILICDGKSTQADVVEALHFFHAHKTVKILSFPIKAFNKARLMNHGIINSEADHLLISDADIIWETSSIEALSDAISNTSKSVGHIAQVLESDLNSSPLQRKRYGYFIEKSSEGYIVSVQQTNDMSSTQRPGCGLVCAERTTFLKLGGYKENFQGWGWEDQDFLIRAALMEIPIISTGQVLHLSHADSYRNQFHHYLAPIASRDRNILTCLEALQRGAIWGDLPCEASDSNPSPNVQIRLPESLKQLAIDVPINVR